MVKATTTLALIMLFLNSFGQNYELTLVKTNLNGNVYSPTYFKNQLVICGDRKNSIGLTFVDNNGLNTIDLYTTDTTQLNSFKPIEDHFRSNLHDGPVVFAKKGYYCAISKNLFVDLKLKKLQEVENSLGIFFSVNEANRWSEFSSFPYNDTSYNCTHPAITEDGQKLYFSSNKPGGYGGYDIWVSEKKNGVWAEPENLGSEINSEVDDLFPTLIGNQLYFSSDRGVMGGLDIYRLTNDKLKVLDESINSTGDDFGLISDNLGKSGFLSSNRSGKDQLYKFSSNTPEFDNCSELVELNLCYTLQEEYASQLSDTKNLIYEWDINGVKVEGVTIDYCFPGVGEYDIVLNITDVILNETYYEQSRYHVSLQHEIQAYISSPNNVVPKKPFMMSAEFSNIPGATITEYHWQTSDGGIYNGLICEHTFKNEGNYDIQLGLIMSNGEKHCVIKKINSTFNEASVIPEKIDESKITDRVNNPNFADPNYVYSIEALHSDSIINDENFRSNLEKYGNIRLKYIEEDKSYVYLVGEFKNIEDAHPVWRELKKEGFKNAVVKPFSKEELDDFQIDKVFVLENLQFDEGSWKIKTDFQKDLNLISSILISNKNLKIRIEAHTDATGTPEFNLQLSENRALAVKQYLIQTGINEDRIEQKGFGESKPIGDNSTNEGKQKNRRVEFTLLK